MTLQAVVILHCFAGADRAGSFRRHVEALAEAAGLWVLVIDVDIEQDAGWDMCDPLLISAILDWIEQGLTDLLLGGPPCSTWSRARFHRGGPPPLRRRGAHAWGLPNLAKAASARVTEANLLLCNFLGLGEALSRVGGAVAMEHPEDPGADPYASVWALPTVLGWEDRVGSRRILLDQCRFGGPTVKSFASQPPGWGWRSSS